MPGFRAQIPNPDRLGHEILGVYLRERSVSNEQIPHFSQNVQRGKIRQSPALRSSQAT